MVVGSTATVATGKAGGTGMASIHWNKEPIPTVAGTSVPSKKNQPEAQSVGSMHVVKVDNVGTIGTRIGPPPGLG